MKKTVLTVDDSASIRQVVGLTLEQAGFSVIQATDGRDALSKLSNAKVDLVITDLNMPAMDGITLIKNLRADPAYRFVPILMLTTESQGAAKQQGKAAGATGWIVKPFKPEQLVATVKRVLE
jgi:two-component system chemotaxis response regulator CheY